MPVFRDISLPTFSDSYGQLDFGASYRPTENLSVSIDFRNLLDEISRTYTTGYSNGKNNRYHEKAPRSWFVSDRRATRSHRSQHAIAHALARKRIESAWGVLVHAKRDAHGFP